MRHLLKWLSISLLLMIAILITFFLTLDIEDYRVQIQNAATKAVGHEVEVSGPISLKPSLVPQIVLKDVIIKNPSWASRLNLAEVGVFELTFDLLSLLGDELVITEVSLDKIDLLIEYSSQGKINLQKQQQSKNHDKKFVSNFSKV